VGPGRPVECGFRHCRGHAVVLKLVKDRHRYPGDLAGFEAEVQAIWRLWRGERTR
jgi:hypothetical protein